MVRRHCSRATGLFKVQTAWEAAGEAGLPGTSLCLNTALSLSRSSPRKHALVSLCLSRSTGCEAGSSVQATLLVRMRTPAIPWRFRRRRLGYTRKKDQARMRSPPKSGSTSRYVSNNIPPHACRPFPGAGEQMCIPPRLRAGSGIRWLSKATEPGIRGCVQPIGMSLPEKSHGRGPCKKFTP